MKKFLIAALFAIIGILAFSQERIAVFPFEDRNNVFIGDEAVMFYREFCNEFTNRNAGSFIAEWCWDLYGRYTGGTQNNPRGPSVPFFNDGVFYRVFRGGHIGDSPRGIRLKGRRRN